MIRIFRPKKPACLSDARVAELTERFKQDKTQRVWNIAGLKKTLLQMTHSKCCYCETRLAEHDSYMEVEHFRYKAKYKDDVLLWENLFPSCKRCNVAKLEHDVVLSPMLNPETDNPPDHLVFEAYFIKGKTAVGVTTVDKLKLNDLSRLVVPRKRIDDEINTALRPILFLARQMEDALNDCAESRDLIARQAIWLLEKTKSDRPFSAITASMLIANASFTDLRESMQRLGLWGDDHEILYDNAQKIML